MASQFKRANTIIDSLDNPKMEQDIRPSLPPVNFAKDDHILTPEN